MASDPFALSRESDDERRRREGRERASAMKLYAALACAASFATGFVVGYLSR